MELNHKFYLTYRKIFLDILVVSLRKKGKISTQKHIFLVKFRQNITSKID